MPFRFNPFTGNLDEVDTTAAAGSDTQIQFNDGGLLAGDVDLTYNKTSNLLTTKGDIKLEGTGSFTTTLQLVTPTADRTISFPDATGTAALVAGSSTAGSYHSLWGGFLGAIPFVENGALTVSNGLGYDEVNGILSVRGGFTTGGAVSSIATLTGNTTFTGRVICSVNNAASAPAGSFTGTWFTTGTSTTTKPAVLVEQSTAATNGWSTAGTGFGVNSTSAFTGRLLDLQQNATSRFSVDAAGMVSYTQGAPAAVDSTATLTAANIQGGIITSDTTAAGVDMTLPAGSDMDTAFVGAYVNQAVMWSVINTAANTATLLAGSDHTIVGAAVVAANTSGRFVSRRTAANTWVSYRLS